MVARSSAKHEWSYFRAGNVVQTEIRTEADLEHLASLDQKLWVALSMPTRGLHAECQTLDALDTDGDGHVRPPELLAAVAWIRSQLTEIAPVLQGDASLHLWQIRAPELIAAAHRVLESAGKDRQEALALQDVERLQAQLAQGVFNGDGVIIPESTQGDETLATFVQCLIDRFDAVHDRSGKAGIDRRLLTRFYAEAQAQIDWHQLGSGFSAQLETAYQAWQAVHSKIDDYFTRNYWVLYDARAHVALDGEWPDAKSLQGVQLDLGTPLLHNMPLARLGLQAGLPLDHRINPAWRSAISRLRQEALRPLLAHNAAELSQEEWLRLQNCLAPYSAWRQAQPDNGLRAWSLADLRGSLDKVQMEQLERLIAADEAVAKEYNDTSSLHKLLLLTRDLMRILRNFVNFSDFYRAHGAMFQVGTLLIDGRATELCIDVTNPAKHLSMASLAGAYLLYCECSRAGETSRSIVAVLTAGESDNLMVGRNGVFYDREGRDWDATVTRIVANPISFREAFWLPYKRFARFIEEQVAKRAAAAEAGHSSDGNKLAEPASPADKKDRVQELAAVGKKIDVGTVAALGVALGSISTFLGVLFGRFLDLGVLMPFGILALILLISCPSMLLAWLKLRNRNLGPILDANGWAINTMARINVPFAASLTSVRNLPLQVTASALPDPYAERLRPWRLYTILALLLFLITLWFVGKLDPLLPSAWQRSRVFVLTVP